MTSTDSTCFIPQLYQPLDDKKPLQKVKYLRIIPKKLRGKDGKKTARAQNGVQQAHGDEDDVKSNKKRKPKQEDVVLKQNLEAVISRACR